MLEESEIIGEEPEGKGTQRTSDAGQRRGKVAICDEEVRNRVELLQERKKERYQEHKAKLLVILKGQCTLNMNNKVESLVGLIQ